MKNLLLSAVFLILISCQGEKKEFSGIGEFEIGKNFLSMASSKNFRKVMDDEYNIQKYKISDEIGYVSDLNITTTNDKISQVTFRGNDQTNIAELEEICKTLIPQNLNVTLLNEIKLRYYTSTDSSIFFTVTDYEKSNRVRFPRYEYIHISKDSASNGNDELRKSLNVK